MRRICGAFSSYRRHSEVTLRRNRFSLTMRSNLVVQHPMRLLDTRIIQSLLTYWKTAETSFHARLSIASLTGHVIASNNSGFSKGSLTRRLIFFLILSKTLCSVNWEFQWTGSVYFDFNEYANPSKATVICAKRKKREWFWW